MITYHGEDVRKTDPHRHKFGSAMAEFLYLLGLDGGEDESCGDAEAPVGYVQRFGKRLLRSDSRGFVDDEKYPTEEIAKRVFAALERAHYEYEEDEDWGDGPMHRLADAYADYAVRVGSAGVLPRTFESWLGQLLQISRSFTT